jgi:hypothetical protein
MLIVGRRRCFSVFRSGYTLSGVVRKSRISNFLNRKGHFLFPEMGWSQAHRFYLSMGQMFFEQSFSQRNKNIWFYPSKDLFSDSGVERSSFSPWDRFYTSRWFGFSGSNILEYKTFSELLLNEADYLAAWCHKDGFYRQLYRHNVDAYKKTKVRGASRDLTERWRDLQVNLDNYVMLSWEDERLYKHKTHQTSMIESFVENVFVMRGFGFYDEENPPRMTWEQAYGELEEHEGPIPRTHRNYFDIDENQYLAYQQGLVSEARRHQIEFPESMENLDFLKRSVALATDVERRVSAFSFQRIEYTPLELTSRDRLDLKTRHLHYVNSLLLWGNLVSYFKGPGVDLFLLKTLILLSTFRSSRAIRIPLLSLSGSTYVDVLSQSWLREAAQAFVAYKTYDRPHYLKRIVSHLLEKDMFKVASFCQKRILRSLYANNPQRWLRSWSTFSFLWDARSYARWLYSLEGSILRKELLTTMTLVSYLLHKNNSRTFDPFDQDLLGRFYWYMWFPSIFSLSKQLGLPYPKTTIEKIKLVRTPSTVLVSYFSGTSSKEDLDKSSLRPIIQRAVFLPKEIRISKNRLSRSNPFSYQMLVQELESRVHAQNPFVRTWFWLAELRSRFDNSLKLANPQLLSSQLSFIFFKFIAKDRYIAAQSNIKRRAAVSSYNQLVFRIKLLGQHRFTVSRIVKDTFPFDLESVSLYRTYLGRKLLLDASLKHIQAQRRPTNSDLILRNLHRPWFFETDGSLDFCSNRVTFADDPSGWLFVPDPAYMKSRSVYTSQETLSLDSDVTKFNCLGRRLTPALLTQRHFVNTQNKSMRLRKLKQDLNYFKKYFSVYDTIKKFEHY